MKNVGSCQIALFCEEGTVGTRAEHAIRLTQKHNAQRPIKMLPLIFPGSSVNFVFSLFSLGRKEKHTTKLDADVKFKVPIIRKIDAYFIYKCTYSTQSC